jgi:hypothetical protein
VYVDDLLIASREPQTIITALETHKFKKGSGPTEFHLDATSFVTNTKDSVMPHQVHSRNGSNYERVSLTETQECYQSTRKEVITQNSTVQDLLNHEDTKIYQSLIGALQWVVQLGRIDIITAVMTMSRFRAAPRQGHMDRVKRIHGLSTR